MDAALADLKPADIPRAAGAESADKLYVLPYLLVILAIAIGLMVVCRPSGRVES